MRALFPPLSLLAVAALTPPEWEIELVDEAVAPVNLDTDADLVGITATTARAPRAYDLADAFRSRGKPVVLGGIHPTALPLEAAQHADAVVVGEAEGTWPKLLADFQEGRLAKIYRHDGLPSLENVPWPRRDLLARKAYYCSATLQTTRGCPFACSFCSVTNFFGRTYRTRPVDDVIAEVEAMPERFLIFVDDNIMGQPAYAKRLFHALIPLRKRWFSQASLTMLKDDNLVRLAAKSGCRGLFVGMESLSPLNLKKMGKTFNPVKRYRECVRKLHDVGIGIIASFIFGLDDDDPSVFERTVEFVQKTKLDAAQFAILTPFPGTTLHRQLEEEGRIIERDWSKYDGAHVTFRPRQLSVDALREGLDWAYRQVYSWKGILQRLLPSWWSPLIWTLNRAYHERLRVWRKHTALAEQTA